MVLVKVEHNCCNNIEAPNALDVQLASGQSEANFVLAAILICGKKIFRQY